MTDIGNSAFCDCIALTSVTIGNSVTSIGDYAFGWCSKLTDITIPDSVTDIGDSAFHSCSSLTSITIPNSVTSIGASAFQDTGLKSVYIPPSVTNIGDLAFGYYYGDGYEKVAGFTIYGKSGSEAETYANDNGFTFTAVYTVSVSDDGNGTASANPTFGVAGTEITLTATSNEGYQFKEWNVVSGDVTVTDNKFTIGDKDVQVQAIFEKEYSVTVTSDGNGTVSADPTSGAEGTEVTLTATPNEGYQFRSCLVVSGGVTVNDNKFTIGTADVQVIAIFEKHEHDWDEPTYEWKEVR